MDEAVISGAADQLRPPSDEDAAAILGQERILRATAEESSSAPKRRATPI